MQIMYLLLGWQRIKNKNKIKKAVASVEKICRCRSFFVHVIGKFSFFYIKNRFAQ